MLFHVVCSWWFEVNQKRSHLRCSHVLNRLRSNYQQTSLFVIYDFTDGIDTSTIVVPLIECMLNKMVILDVLLHLSTTHEVEVHTVHLIHILITRCVCNN